MYAITDLDAVVPRAEVDVTSTVSAVLPIIEQVRSGGASAVLEQIKKGRAIGEWDSH